MRLSFLSSRSQICRIADLFMIFAIVVAGTAAAILSLVAQVSR